LDGAWPQHPLTEVVIGSDVSGEVAEREHLVRGQRTIGGAGKDGIEIAFQRSLVSLGFTIMSDFLERAGVSAKSR
jgi:hypothetical protein